MGTRNECGSVRLVSAGALLALVLAGTAAGQVTSRVSVSSSGAQGIGHSGLNSSPSISADSRYVAFHSDASNLVSGDTNARQDGFVRDRESGTTERVSVDSGGAQGNLDSFSPVISADGRWVAFGSYATNLVGGDTGGWADIFVHDRQSGATERVSLDSSGVPGNEHSYNPSISSDGRYVTFESYASNLVGGDTNNELDIFVRDRQSGTTERASIDSAGTEGNALSNRASISADGRYVAFGSYATNLVGGDTNGFTDVFIHDRQSGSTERVSVDSVGVQGNRDSFFPSISADGRYVAYGSDAGNLVSGDTNHRADVFVHDRQSGMTERVSVASGGAEANDHSRGLPSISADGRFVTYNSNATNLVVGDTNGWADAFLHDRQSGLTERVSVDSGGAEGNDFSTQTSVSADGRCVAFFSTATNLVGGDTNSDMDAFVRDRGAEVGTKYCTANPNSTGSPADLSASGSASSGASYLALTSMPVPDESGIFFHGTNPAQVPFGNGFMCTTGGIVRGVVVTGVGNVAAYVYDNSDAKHSLAAFVGSTRNFQHWFRDPAAGGAFFNTSNAMAIAIAP